MTTITDHARALGAILTNKAAGRGWRAQASDLAARLRHDGATVLADQLRQAVDLGGRPSTKGQVDSLLAQVAGTLAELDDTPPAPVQRAPRPAPATVVPTRYAPDGITVLQPRAGEPVTLLVQVDGRDLQALELSPELATHLLHGLLDHASRPRLDRR